jgi:site-specific DNA-cytosine methylase
VDTQADPDGHARTLTSTYRSGFHMYSEFLVWPLPAVGADIVEAAMDVPTGGRRLRFYTERECARIQGFPDAFVIQAAGFDRAFYKLAGNAVCPLVVQAIGAAIIRALPLRQEIS